jgi:hypothetical protein
MIPKNGTDIENANYNLGNCAKECPASAVFIQNLSQWKVAW